MGEAAKVHKHLIKWLRKIIKKKGECTYARLPGDVVLIIQKCIVMSQKDGC